MRDAGATAAAAVGGDAGLAAARPVDRAALAEVGYVAAVELAAADRALAALAGVQRRTLTARLAELIKFLADAGFVDIGTELAYGVLAEPAGAVLAEVGKALLPRAFGPEGGAFAAMAQRRAELAVSGARELAV